MTRQCKKCLNNDSNPYGFYLDYDGICVACKRFEEKRKFNIQDLELLVDRYKNKHTYDCILPISGGKDSWFLVDFVTKTLNLHPLCVSYNSHFTTPQGFMNLTFLKEAYDLDVVNYTLNPEIVKRVTRHTFWKYGNPMWHVQAGSNAVAINAAVDFKIPLVIFARNQAQIHGGVYSKNQLPEYSKFAWEEFDLRSQNISEISKISGVKEQDLSLLNYPENGRIAELGLRGIYLSNYMEWDSYQQFWKLNNNHQWSGYSNSSTLYSYQHSDNWLYEGVHDYMRWLKLGHGKIMDNLNQEIRHGRISRNIAESIFLEMQRKPWEEQIDKFCSYLGISKKSFDFIANQHRNLRYYDTNNLIDFTFKNLYKYSSGEWRFEHKKCQAKIETMDKENALYGKGKY
jgi:N-acetyl sugar amidotransferase